MNENCDDKNTSGLCHNINTAHITMSFTDNAIYYPNNYFHHVQPYEIWHILEDNCLNIMNNMHVLKLLLPEKAIKQLMADINYLKKNNLSEKNGGKI